MMSMHHHAAAVAEAHRMAEVQRALEASRKASTNAASSSAAAYPSPQPQQTTRGERVCVCHPLFPLKAHWNEIQPPAAPMMPAIFAE